MTYRLRRFVRGFGFLGRGIYVGRSWLLSVLGRSVHPVYVHFAELRLLLVALGWRSFGLLFGLTLGGRRVLESQGSLNSLLSIEGPWFTLCARVNKVWTNCFLFVVGVKTFDVLPRIACLAKNRTSVIVREVTDTLDRVWLFFFYRVNFQGHLIFDDGTCRERCGGLTRNRMWQRQRSWPICHNIRGTDTTSLRLGSGSGCLSTRYGWHDDAYGIARRDQNEVERTRGHHRKRHASQSLVCSTAIENGATAGRRRREA